MSDSTSPLVLRRRLRTELRTARLERQLTQDQVAKAMDWSLSKMNRIEKAKSGISVNDLKVLLMLYGITDRERIEELIALARTARHRTWWSGYSDVAPAELLELMDFESAASAVSQFEIITVPRILQTEEYAWAVMHGLYGESSAAERVAPLVELHTKSRDLLTSEDAPIFSFVLDESIIHRQVGSPAVISQQLMHLVQLAQLPNVTIRIAPFTIGLHPGMNGPFEVVQFEDAPDENIVFLNGPRGDFIIDDSTETEGYLSAFRRIVERSLGPSESLGRLRQVAQEIV